MQRKSDFKFIRFKLQYVFWCYPYYALLLDGVVLRVSVVKGL